MALLRNREVEILGKADGADASPTYTVLYPDGSRENVSLSHLQVTDEEFKNLQKANGETVMTNVSKIDQKEYQEIKDGQDKAKIEARQGKQTPGPVEVSKVMVDPAEVQDKSTITPQMTKDQRKNK